MLPGSTGTSETLLSRIGDTNTTQARGPQPVRLPRCNSHELSPKTVPYLEATVRPHSAYALNIQHVPLCLPAAGLGTRLRGGDVPTPTSRNAVEVGASR